MISISVKTSLKEKLGTLCVIDQDAAMEDILFKIQQDLGLAEEVTNLVRLLPNGKQMHSVVRKPEFITDMDFYMAILEGDEGQEEESSVDSQETPVERNRTTPVRVASRGLGRPRKVTPAKRKSPAAKKTVAPPAKMIQPVKASRRQKAKASVARATAALNAKKTAPAKKKRRVFGNKNPLSAEDRQALASVKLDIDHFEQYLYEVEGITQQNVRVVVKQVKRLHDGLGIDYKHWRNGVVFKPGYVLRLSDDFDAMREEAVAFEKKHGRYVKFKR
jgi:hypothetical protein